MAHLLAVILATTAMFTFMFGPFVLAEYFYDSKEYRDKLYFLRRTIFRRKLKKRKIKDVEYLVEKVFRTSENDWQYVRHNKKMVWYPFADLHTHIAFRKEEERYFFGLYENTREILLMTLSIPKENKQPWFWINGFGSGLTKEKHGFKLEHVILHVIPFLESLTEKDGVKKTEEEKARAEHKRKQLEITPEMHMCSLLFEALSSPLLKEKGEYDDFALDWRETDFLSSAVLTYKGVVCYSALQKDGIIHTDIPVSEELFVQVINKQKSVIEDFLFSRNEEKNQAALPEITSVSIPLPKELSNHLKERLASIERKMQTIKQDSGWLSESDAHLVNVTYPDDINRLIQAYRHTDKNKTEHALTETLSCIEQVLIQLENKAAEAKRNNFERERQIVQIRSAR